jgi:hypothetical protein
MAGGCSLVFFSIRLAAFPASGDLLHSVLEGEGGTSETSLLLYFQLKLESRLNNYCPDFYRHSQSATLTLQGTFLIFFMSNPNP